MVPEGCTTDLTPEEVLLFLLLDLAIIIMVARGMGMLARRVGQPAVIGEVLGGILLGPTVLGRFDTCLPFEVFPAQVPLGSIANIGLVFFIFLVGLELDPKLIRQQGRKAAQISLSGVITPLVLGTIAGLLMFNVNADGEFIPGHEEPDRLTFGLFIGAAMCITAFPVLARILVESGIYKTPVGTLTLCAAAVDDVCAWILLAAVVGIAETGSPVDAAIVIAGTAVFAALVFLIGRPLFEVLARRYDRLGHLTIDMVAIILAGVLLSAAATEEIGIHAIFGAFIFGAMLPKRSGMVHEITDKVEDFTVIVLLPCFFLVTGLRTDLFTLDDPSLIGWLLLILAVAIGGKFLGCGIAAKLTGSSTKDAVVIGSLMNTRGLTELVILNIGLNELGVLSDTTFAMMVIMALTTTVMAAPIVNRLMPREQLLQEITAAERGVPLPTATRILVSISNSLTAAALLDVALRLTGKKRPAELLLVRLLPTVRSPEIRTGLQEEDLQMVDVVESMQELVDQAAAAGVSARPLSFLSDDFARDLADLARDQKCDMLLLAEEVPGTKDFDSNRVLIRQALTTVGSDVAVLVGASMRGAERLDGRPIVLALAGDVHDASAGNAAQRLAEASDTSVRVIGFVGADGRDPAAASKELALYADALHEESGVAVHPDFRSGDATQATIEASQESAITVVSASGAESEGQFAAPVERLMRAAPSPVLAVRAGSAVAAIAGAPPAADWPFISPTRAEGEEPPAIAIPDQPHLQRLNPWGEPMQTFAIGDSIDIGRAPDNRLVLLEDNLVSRQHAAVEARNGSFVLRDLGSTNGTMLWRDGRWQEITEETMQDGDLVVVGENVFRFRADLQTSEVE
jgi:K+:H+ antiporter